MYLCFFVAPLDNAIVLFVKGKANRKTAQRTSDSTHATELPQNCHEINESSSRLYWWAELGLIPLHPPCCLQAWVARVFFGAKTTRQIFTFSPFWRNRMNVVKWKICMLSHINILDILIYCRTLEIKNIT